MKPFLQYSAALGAAMLSCLVWSIPAFSKSSLEIEVYEVKQKAHYTAVDIGIRNTGDKPLDFSSDGIYLDSKDHYSVPPLLSSEVNDIVKTGASNSFIPGVLGLGLGIAAISGGLLGIPAEAVIGLGTAAAVSGTGVYLAKHLEEKSRSNQLIQIESNSLDSTTHIPSGMTLGGRLYFPKSKSPTGITLIANNEKLAIPISAHKSSSKTNSHKENRK